MQTDTPRRGLRFLTPDEYTAWDQFVELHSAGRIYHTTAWKQALDAAYAPSRYQIAVVYHENEIVGGCCFLHKRKWRLVPVASHPLLTQYCGFLFGEAMSDRARHDLCDAMKRNYFKQRFSCAPGVKVGSGCNYHQTERCTLWLNLKRPLQNIREGIDPAMRRQIRKAERLTPVLTHDLSPKVIQDLLASTLSRNARNTSVPALLVESLVTRPALEKTRTISGARLDGEIASVIVSYVYKNVAYYSIAATDPAKLSTGISPWLVEKFIENCHQEGIEAIDFLGGNLESIAQFKRKFGAQPRQYLELSMGMGS